MLTEIEAHKVIKQYVASMPDTLVMLGTGWNKVLDGVKPELEIGYKELFGVEASVPGHEGKLVIASVGGKRTAFMVGRLHMYEGYTGEQTTLPIRVLGEAGIKQLVVTAAVGGLNERYQVGDFCLTSDLLTLFLALDNPLVGPKFLDMSQVFDPELRAIARQALTQQQVSFHEGVYAYYHGPNFETPADKMALHHLGADVCGMSTAPETIMAKWLGLKVVSLAFVTNLAFVKHAHEDVLAAATAAESKMSGVIEQMLQKM